MKKIFEDANEQHVTSVIVYGDTTDHKLYDKATGEDKAQITEEELQNLFIKKQLVISVDGDLFIPVSVSDNSAFTVAEVSSAVSLVEWTAKAAD